MAHMHPHNSLNARAPARPGCWRCSAWARALRWAARGWPASLLALNAPEDRRGWYAMIPQLGAPLGLIVASLLFAFFTAFAAGGRFPGMGLALSFLRGLRNQRGGAVRAAAHRGDARIPDAVRNARPSARTRACHAAHRMEDHPDRRAGPAGQLRALFHMVTVFPLSWVFLFTREGADALPGDRGRRRRGWAWPPSSPRASWRIASVAAACSAIPGPRRSRCSAASRHNCSIVQGRSPSC